MLLADSEYEKRKAVSVVDLASGPPRKRQKADSGVEMTWLGFMWRLCTKKTPPEEITNGDAATVVLQTMRCHPCHAKVQMYGCSILAVVALTKIGVSAITMQGGVGTVVTAMTQHAEHEEVQVCGCWALANLSVYTKQTRGITVIQALLRATQRYHTSQRVVLLGFYALCSAWGHNNDTAMVQTEMREVVTKAATQHEDNPIVQERAKFILANIEYHSKAPKGGYMIDLTPQIPNCP